MILLGIPDTPVSGQVTIEGITYEGGGDEPIEVTPLGETEPCRTKNFSQL